MRRYWYKDVNMIGVDDEKWYKQSIMSSSHGAWSVAGITGALIGLLTMNLGIDTHIHFLIIFCLIVINTWINYPHLIPGKGDPQHRSSFFTKPESSMIQLGIIGFFSMATEGTKIGRASFRK